MNIAILILVIISAAGNSVCAWREIQGLRAPRTNGETK